MKHVPVLNSGASAGTSAGASAEFSSTASTESVFGFGDKFKKPEGAWDCDVCLVQNKAVDVQCVACQAVKPGANVEPKGNKSGTRIYLVIILISNNMYIIISVEKPESFKYNLH